MTENAKKMYGITVCSSEKKDSHNRYSEFSLNAIPFPGVEFFREFSYTNPHQSILKMKFDWSQTSDPAAISINYRHPRHHHPGTAAATVTPPRIIRDGYGKDEGAGDSKEDDVKDKDAVEEEWEWSDYQSWDIITLTRRYLQLMVDIVCDPTSDGLLIHCISGWDRTPMASSLLRLSLWADGVLHQSLDVHQIIYLTIAYDWMLFRHQLNMRQSRGEDIFYFCFHFLQFLQDPELSVHHRRHKHKHKHTHNHKYLLDGGHKQKQRQHEREAGRTVTGSISPTTSSTTKINTKAKTAGTWAAMLPHHHHQQQKRRRRRRRQKKAGAANRDGYGYGHGDHDVDTDTDMTSLELSTFRPAVLSSHVLQPTTTPKPPQADEHYRHHHHHNHNYTPTPIHDTEEEDDAECSDSSWDSSSSFASDDDSDNNGGRSDKEDDRNGDDDNGAGISNANTNAITPPAGGEEKAHQQAYTKEKEQERGDQQLSALPELPPPPRFNDPLHEYYYASTAAATATSYDDHSAAADPLTSATSMSGAAHNNDNEGGAGIEEEGEEGDKEDTGWQERRALRLEAVRLQFTHLHSEFIHPGMSFSYWFFAPSLTWSDSFNSREFLRVLPSYCPHPRPQLR
jgi:hypothetical protein